MSNHRDRLPGDPNRSNHARHDGPYHVSRRDSRQSSSRHPSYSGSMNRVAPLRPSRLDSQVRSSGSKASTGRLRTPDVSRALREASASRSSSNTAQYRFPAASSSSSLVRTSGSYDFPPSLASTVSDSVPVGPRERGFHTARGGDRHRSRDNRSGRFSPVRGAKYHDFSSERRTSTLSADDYSPCGHSLSRRSLEHHHSSGVPLNRAENRRSDQKAYPEFTPRDRLSDKKKRTNDFSRGISARKKVVSQTSGFGTSDRRDKSVEASSSPSNRFRFAATRTRTDHDDDKPRDDSRSRTVSPQRPSTKRGRQYDSLRPSRDRPPRDQDYLDYLDRKTKCSKGETECSSYRITARAGENAAEVKPQVAGTWEDVEPYPFAESPPPSPLVVHTADGEVLNCPVPRRPKSTDFGALRKLELDAIELDEPH